MGPNPRVCSLASLPSLTFLAPRPPPQIQKEDVNIPTLTVRETLTFSCVQRLPRTTTAASVKRRVDAWLELLGLSHVADTVVGSATLRGISGGEKRRVSIGVEAVVGHRIIVADSPTNGLDSAAALKVIQIMRALADSGALAFVANVRQPSPELLTLFDTTCLMSRGSAIYWGPTANAEEFLAEHGVTRPPGKSLPDFLEYASPSLRMIALCYFKPFIACTHLACIEAGCTRCCGLRVAMLPFPHLTLDTITHMMLCSLSPTHDRLND